MLNFCICGANSVSYEKKNMFLHNCQSNCPSWNFIQLLWKFLQQFPQNQQSRNLKLVKGFKRNLFLGLLEPIFLIQMKCSECTIKIYSINFKFNVRFFAKWTKLTKKKRSQKSNERVCNSTFLNSS